MYARINLRDNSDDSFTKADGLFDHLLLRLLRVGLVFVLVCLSSLGTANQAKPAFQIKSIDNDLIPPGNGNVSHSFNVTATIENTDNYQYMFSIGSMEGRCQSEPNNDFTQPIRDVIQHGVTFVSSPKHCKKLFHLGVASSACTGESTQLHEIYSTFTMKIHRSRLTQLSEQDKARWDSMHLTIRDQNKNSCASEPIFIDTKPDVQVKISDLDNMLLTERGDFGYEQDELFCVYVTDKGRYRIKASGGVESQQPFLLYNGDESIPYIVKLLNANKTPTVVQPGDWLDSTTGHDVENCNYSSNAQVGISVTDESISRKPAGVYTGTLYLTVEPS